MSIRIPIISDFDSKGIDKAINEFKSLEGAGKKAQFAIKKAAVPAAAALTAMTGALGAATYAAMEDQKEQAALALTLQNVTGAGAAQTAQIEKQISAMSKASGVTDTEYRKALENLVRGTKVSPEMASMIKEGASLNQVMDVLGGTFGGATAKAAGTAAGQMKILKNSLSETSESIGMALLPVVQAVLPILNRFAAWAQENPKVFLAIAAAIGLVAAAIVATNIAMALNPFSLIAAGIAVLVVALGVAYNKFSWFKSGVDAIINGILGAFENMVNGAIMAVNAIIRAYNSIPILKNVDTIS
ncbi:MAG: hypothetical protein EBY21_15285, partial [Alphaproteobacteria bacterium]|nr:hypothetical protein [Alphaproteobacteria bacterium]